MRVGRDEHPTMRDADEPVLDGNVDGLTGEPHPDLVGDAREADLAVPTNTRVVTGPTVSIGLSNGSWVASRNRSHGATIPIP